MTKIKRKRIPFSGREVRASRETLRKGVLVMVTVLVEVMD
jgi:hypothetical protein